MPTRLDIEPWLNLVAGGGRISVNRAGFTPRLETRVFRKRRIPQHLIYFCTRGGFAVVVGGKSIQVERGTFFWLMPNVMHETKLLASGTPFQNYYIRFSLTDADGITPVQLTHDCIKRDSAWELLPLLVDISQEHQSPRVLQEYRIRGALMRLSAEALGDYLPQSSMLTSQQQLRLRNYVEVHVAEKITIEDLAEIVGLSTQYFRRVFHRSYGMSPKHWIIRKRIQLAALLLAETEMQAKEVSHQLGYCDRYLFSRQFKQIMGTTPKDFRKGKGAQQPWLAMPHGMYQAPAFQRLNVSPTLTKLR